MRSFWKTVLLTSLVVGITDLSYAYINQYVITGKFADKMLQYIAGGALGLEVSMKGGLPVQLLGLFFHFFIAFAFTLLFFYIYPKLKLQKLNIYLLCLIGLLYGPFVNLFMRFVVLPMSRIPSPKSFDFEKVLIGWIFFALVFSLPIALSAGWYYKRLKKV